jgi:hypothetical protein
MPEQLKWLWLLRPLCWVYGHYYELNPRRTHRVCVFCLKIIPNRPQWPQE